MVWLWQLPTVAAATGHRSVCCVGVHEDVPLFVTQAYQQVLQYTLNDVVRKKIRMRNQKMQRVRVVERRRRLRLSQFLNFAWVGYALDQRISNDSVTSHRASFRVTRAVYASAHSRVLLRRFESRQDSSLLPATSNTVSRQEL